MQSMTGFGTAKSKGLQVSLRSVNGRFLETRFHIPREFSDLEATLKKRLGEKVSRGTLDIFVNLQKGEASARTLKVDRALAKQLRNEAKGLAKELGLAGDGLSIKDILQMSGVVSIEESPEVTGGQKKSLEQLFNLALKNLVSEREREGKAIAKVLLGQLQKLLNTVGEIQTLGQKLGRELEVKLHERIARSKENVDPVRLGQELIFYLDRSDISEELARLEEHLRSCQTLVKKGGQVGKRLDFFCQELLREVNTIGSKSVSAEMTSRVVDGKTLIESFREQVQNLE